MCLEFIKTVLFNYKKKYCNFWGTYSRFKLNYVGKIKPKNRINSVVCGFLIYCLGIMFFTNGL